jgi:hypothetical protein
VASLVAGRPHAMSLAGWLAWAAIALVILGAIVRVAEVVWGAACTAYVLVRSPVAAVLRQNWLRLARWTSLLV